MLGYYFRLGLRSLRRNPALTALMVMAIGFGVAASMITYAVFRAVSGNPIPEKSERLFTPQIDSWGPQHNIHGEPPYALNYVDAMALMRAHQATRQTLLYPVWLSVSPEGSRGLPVGANGYAVYGDFFPMFDVPFLYGGRWSADDDQRHAAAVVLGEEFNQRLFGGANSVGREIVLGGHAFRIVGVTRHWNPRPRFFALWGSGGFAEPTDFYLPFTRAIDLKLDTAGNNSCRGQPDFSGWDGWLQSTCVWITPWVELDGDAQAAHYRRFLEGYAADQRRAGRFAWAPNVRLRNVVQWLDYQQVVPPESRIALVVALGFFVICLVNTIGLLLAKFMRRAGEIGVRRALGAPRRQIYAQYLLEAASVGLAGGVLGLLLTAAGMSGVGLLFEPQIARLARLDFSLVGLCLLAAVLATLAAAFYPAWRAAQVQPAWQLKSH
ncbi:ABC transporter permease [Fulvimonas soli]|uniref:Putative ABC transport system permease protein n=1 Tax=Fulvimonas soli TaxID=155197 RepID=A0A316I607_9GAMM|nr:ABC transporter permease [Fulvimonas soli]PWK88706.1 putative ABC transport system permease protein [Fulvimonas soli]TNY25463.1 peptide ABC transporter permease [Fulvimonas soli]